MKKLLSIFALLAGVFFANSASAVTYSCPQGGTASGSICSTPSKAATFYPCNVSGTVFSWWGPMVWYNCGPLGANSTTIYTMTNCSAGGWGAGYPNSPLGNNMVCSGWWAGHVTAAGSFICNGFGNCNAFYGQPPVLPVGHAAYYSCASFPGSTLSGTVCVYPNYPATVAYTCNPGDTLLANNTCQPPTLYAAQTTHYSCVDKDGNGVIDPFAPGSITTCRPNLLAYTGEPVWYCPIVAGDPDPIVANAATWGLNGVLQAAAAGYTVPGPLGLPVASASQWVGGTTCSYTPPKVDGVLSFISHYCIAPNVLDVSGLWCVPPKTTTPSIVSSVFSCIANDALTGQVCTPALLTYSAMPTSSYTCPATMPIGTILNALTGTCTPPVQIQPPTPVATKVCGASSKLNAVTGMCDYVSIPAINTGGAYSCPALYQVGTGAQAGWCIPTAQWSYPATWNLTKYDCPNGGTLGLNTAGQPNGLCYMP